MDIRAVLEHLDWLFAEKRLEQVEPYLTQHLAEARQEGDAGAALTLLNELAGFYRSTSQTEKSLDMAKQALKAIQDMGLAGTSAHGTTLINAATAYRAAGNRERAASLYQEALATLQSLGASGYSLASLLNNMSQLFQDLGRHGEALSFLEQALALLAPREDAAEIATTHANMALSLLSLNRLPEAQEHLEQAFALFEAGDGPRDAHYGAALAAAGELAYREGDFRQAVDWYQKALPEIRSSFGENEGYRITCQNLEAARNALAQQAASPDTLAQQAASPDPAPDTSAQQQAASPDTAPAGAGGQGTGVRP